MVGIAHLKYVSPETLDYIVLISNVFESGLPIIHLGYLMSYSRNQCRFHFQLC